MSAPRSVVVVGHDASRTGAPVALLTLLKWLTRSTQADLATVLLRGGELAAAYAATTPTVVLEGSGQPASLLGRVPRRWRNAASTLTGRGLTAVRRERHPDVVLANSLASLEAAVHLVRRDPAVRLVCWVHELDGVADRVLPTGPRRRRLLARVDAFAAVSGPVAQMLVERHGVPEASVRTIGPAPEPEPPRAVGQGRPAPLADLDPDRPLVVAVGALGARKGPERFADLVTVLAGHPRRPVGVWVGGGPGSPGWDEMCADVRRAPDETCRLVQATAGARSYLRHADLVVSTAIEDPFPLVLLEAAAAGTPVAGYDSGGIAELLTAVEQADALVRVGDTLALAAVVGRLLDRPDELAARGRALAREVQSRHSVDELGACMWELIVG